MKGGADYVEFDRSISKRRCWREHRRIIHEGFVAGHCRQFYCRYSGRWHWWPIARAFGFAWAAGGGMDIGSIVSSIAGGGVGGGVLMTIIGVVKKAMAK